MQHFRRRYAASLMSLAASLTFAPFAQAQAPRPWQIGLQKGYSPVQRDIIQLHDLVLVIITLITLFVGVLLAWVVYRYRATRNPNPSRTSHNTVLEVAWTLAPVLILIIIAIPSFRLVYFENRTQNADMTVKVTGHQWYWEYTYPDYGNLDFSSYIVADDDLKPGQMRLLEVDNQLVVPAQKNIRILNTSADVIHSFFIPSLGVQRYAIPGRTIETWFRAEKPGTYYGQCNQICGTNHSRMPIVIHAVPEQEFTAWLEQAKTKFSEATPGAPAQGLTHGHTQQLASVAEAGR